MGWVADKIIKWQAVHGRADLPWQGTRDAYRIWVSEVMLQQTQVGTVLGYYGDFLRRFPDVYSLAGASDQEVMAAWSGLGYYSRARNLHACARQVVNQHHGSFPQSAAQLQELPGIGRSTAAAIAAFAFGERAAILDGNVKRVFCRLFGIEGVPDTSQTLRLLWSIAQRELPANRVERYTQGLMDLGAMLCTRSNPRCDQCPVRRRCQAFIQGRTGELPERKSRGVKPQR
ncbi:MAG: A/G-specific adenine glycosylase, partial [Quisquiliibacterium sp.]